jgi:hypothetical protein
MALILSFAFAGAVFAAGPDVKVTRGRAEERKGEELRCRVAMNEQRFLESLQAAAWTTDTKTPKIDWTSQAAVIIAPRLYVQDHRPAFVSMKSEGEKVTIDWILRVEKPDLVEEKHSAGMSSYGSTGIGPEILILVVSRAAIESKKVSCKGPKRKES